LGVTYGANREKKGRLNGLRLRSSMVINGRVRALAMGFEGKEEADFSYLHGGGIGQEVHRERNGTERG